MSNFDEQILNLLEKRFHQHAFYWRYVAVKGVLEWQCSVDGESWWAASERTVLA